MIDDTIDEAVGRMKKTVDVVVDELRTVRTGKASISVLDGVMVDYYGTPTPLNQIASLATPDASLITIKPYDKSAAKEIEKAVQKADLGLNPSSDGEIIRVPIPALSEERRKMMVKRVAEITESGKTAIRQIRRETNDKIKALEKGGEISEDQMHTSLDEVQELTDEYTNKIEKLKESKEKELMTV